MSKISDICLRYIIPSLTLLLSSYAYSQAPQAELYNIINIESNEVVGTYRIPEDATIPNI